MSEAPAPADPSPGIAPAKTGPLPAPGAARQILLGVACALASVAIRWAIDPWLGDRQPFTPAFAGVAVAAWYGGWRAGVLCAVLAQLASNYLFIPPRGHFTWNASELVGSGTYYLIAALLLFLSHRARTANEALRLANHRLRDADRHRSEFLATLAHELRSPLGAIRTSLHVLEISAAREADRLRAQAAMNRQVEHITRLMDDLMDASRIDQGKISLQRSRVSVARLVETAVEAGLPHLQQRSQQLEVRMPPDAGELDVDPARLVQVLSNLLHNASKFSPAGSTITLEVRREPRALRLRVIDRGAGIPPERVDWIFDAFSQLQPGSEGLGLGLALVRKLVELHGGTVSARSEGTGRGATFEVSLPPA